MSKVTEFLDKVMADEAAKAEFEAVIGVRKERELNDGDFQKIVELSEKLGAAVTLDEVKDFFSGNGRELSEEELAGVASGSYKADLGLVWVSRSPHPPSPRFEWTTYMVTYRCKNCGKTKMVSWEESPSLFLEDDCPAGDFLGHHEYEKVEVGGYGNE